jgi:hypothetical protein
VAKLLAGVLEGVWTTFRLSGAPPLTRTLIYLMGEEVTVSDAKARRELGYTASVSRERGLREMRLDQDAKLQNGVERARPSSAGAAAQP